MLPARFRSCQTATADLFILNMFVLPPITLPSAASGVIMRLLFNLRAADTEERNSTLEPQRKTGRSLLEMRTYERNGPVKTLGLVATVNLLSIAPQGSAPPPPQHERTQLPDVSPSGKRSAMTSWP